MTLTNLCDLFDCSFIADHKADLNSNYKASSDLIYSDGKIESHIDKDGYIIIESVDDDANYLVFLDQNGDIFLAVYRYLLEVKYKEVIDCLNNIRSQTGIKRHQLIDYDTDNNKEKFKYNNMNDDDSLSKFTGVVVVEKDNIEEPLREDDEVLVSENDAKLVNINNMECDECGSNKFIEPFWLYRDGRLKCKCAECGTIYDLIPSKYYLINSKRIFNNAEHNKNRRQIIPKEDI